MRQLIVRVPRGHGTRVLTTAGRHGGTNMAVVEAEAKGGAVDLAIIHISNAQETS